MSIGRYLNINSIKEYSNRENLKIVSMTVLVILFAEISIQFVFSALKLNGYSVEFQIIQSFLIKTIINLGIFIISVFYLYIIAKLFLGEISLIEIFRISTFALLVRLIFLLMNFIPAVSVYSKYAFIILYWVVLFLGLSKLTNIKRTIYIFLVYIFFIPVFFLLLALFDVVGAKFIQTFL